MEKMKNHIETKRLNRIEDLHEIGFVPGPINPIFRGHADVNWPLLPSIERLIDVGASTSDPEGSIVEEFQRHSLPFLNSKPVSILDWLTVAQHHGLPTRLLDWSESPLVALYFSVFDRINDDKDGALWFYQPESVALGYEEKELSELNREYQYSFVYYPSNHTMRVTSQKSCFTCHQMKNGEGRRVRFEEEYAAINPRWPLVKYVVPKETKLEFRRQLAFYGINAFMIYPGLDGLAEKLKWDYGSRWYYEE